MALSLCPGHGQGGPRASSAPQSRSRDQTRAGWDTKYSESTGRELSREALTGREVVNTGGLVAAGQPAAVVPAFVRVVHLDVVGVVLAQLLDRLLDVPVEQRRVPLLTGSRYYGRGRIAAR